MPTFSQTISTDFQAGYKAQSSGTFLKIPPNTSMESGNDSIDTYADFVRFTNVTIPQGSIINSAKVTLNSGSGPLMSNGNLIIKGIAEDNTSDYSTDPSGRTRTSASVAWNPMTQSSFHTYQDSPDITSIIQEIVNRSGWASGNALGIVIADNGSAAHVVGNFVGHGSNGGTDESAQITIVWSNGTTTSTTTTTSTSTSTSTTTTSTSTSSTTLPPESYGIYVKRAGPNIILPKTLPRNFFMNSNYKMLRIHQQGSFKLTVPKGDAGGTLTIGFPQLPYRPLTLVYMQRYNADGTLDSTYHLLEWSYWGASKVGWQSVQIYPDKLIIGYRDQTVEELLGTSFSVLGYYYIFRERVDG